MREYVIYPMAVGVNETDQGIMTYLRDYGKRIILPVYAFYLKGGDQTILVDTGLEQFYASEAVRQACDFDILEFEEALARHDLTPEDVDVVIHTHLHNDHCENDYKCPNARIYVQQRERAFMEAPHPLDHRYYPDVLDDLNVIELDGDAEILDGVDVIFSPGHTAGGQSVSVRTSAGRAVITGFCCNDKNFPATGPAVAPGVHIDATEAYDAAQKIRDMADILIPLHAMSVGARRRIPD